MRKFAVLILLFASLGSVAQKKDNRWFKGMYLQWGYNTEVYTHSNIHFRMAGGDNFTIYDVKAHDKTDYDAVYKKPGDITIPQFNYRIGLYLNTKHTKAVEINFDHAKYIVDDFQKVRIKGTLNGVHVDTDTILNPSTFLHFEHTDGANWLHINYVEQHTISKTRSKSRPLLNYVWKVGAGINIPRTDITWRGDRLNNNFHIAGYNISAEGGLRFFLLKKLFIEATAKTGFVRYVNALANTTAQKGNRATHSFGYLEAIATVGYDINF